MIRNDNSPEVYDNRPIGVFDSGIGGLTVLREIWQTLPNESTIYFGDCGRTPYGTKSHETIVTYSLQDMRFLLRQNVKMIVIACSTASAHAFEDVRREAGIPVVEVITPGANEAVRITRNGRIGVAATRATVASGVYLKALQAADEVTLPAGKENREIYIEQQTCPLFVSLAEEGWWDNEIAYLTALEYLRPMRDNQVDTLVLGCTHYPLLAPTIARVMGESVQLVNSGTSVASRMKTLLSELKLAASPDAPLTREFYTSDDPERFDLVTSPFLGGQNVTGSRHVRVEEYDD